MQSETRFLPFEKTMTGRFRVGKTKAWELAKSGQIKTVKLGRKTLVTEAEAERFARSLTEAA